MRKALHALAILIAGAFAFAAGAPAQAMPSGPLASLTGITKAAPAAEKVYYRRRYSRYRYCCRRPYWGWYGYPYWRYRYNWRRPHVRCYWYHGYRRCRRYW
jgi:hypothetical protein